MLWHKAGIGRTVRNAQMFRKVSKLRLDIGTLHRRIALSRLCQFKHWSYQDVKRCLRHGNKKEVHPQVYFLFCSVLVVASRFRGTGKTACIFLLASFAHHLLFCSLLTLCCSFIQNYIYSYHINARKFFHIIYFLYQCNSHSPVAFLNSQRK